MRGNLHHQVPPCTVAAGFDLRPETVRDWVRQLPFGNLAEIPRLLLGALRQVNARNTDPGELFHFLEAIGPAASVALGYLEARYVRQPLPLQPADHAAARFSMQLTVYLMRGYSAVLRCARGGGTWPWHLFRTRHRRAAALHRIFRYADYLIRIHRQLHRDPPAGTWQRVHRYRLVAEAEGLLARRVRCFDEEHRKTTVDHEYKRLLLGAMLPATTDPAVQAEIRATMDEWVRLVTLRRSGDASVADYAVRLDRDCGVLTVAGMDAGTFAGVGTRFLDTRALSERLKSPGRGADWLRQRRESPASCATLAMLHDGWCSRQTRTEPRTSVHVPAEVAVGLRVLFQRVGGRPGVANRSVSFRGGGIGQAVESDGESPEIQGQNGDSAVLGRILDRSEQGACVVIPWHPAHRIAVGMAVAVRTREEGWCVGTVTWFKHRRALVGLGARFHLRGAMPARLHTVEGEQVTPQSDVVVGRGRDDGWVVVAPAVFAHRRGEPVLNVGARTVRVEWGAALCRSSHVEIFSLRAVGGKPLVLEPVVACAPVPVPVPVVAEALNRAVAGADASDREAWIRRLMEQTGLSRSDSELIAEIEMAANR